MSANCRVCNSELIKKYSKCPYCGYSNSVALTVSCDDSEEYRQNIIKKIKQISVEADKFKYSVDEGEIKEVGIIPLFENNLDGIKCSQKLVKSKEWIAHFDKEEFIVRYTFGDINKAVEVYVQAEEWEGIWHLAIRLNEELRLEVGLYIEPISGEGRVEILDTVDLDLIL